MARTTYVIAYRTGGTHDCRWTRLLTEFPSRESAELTRDTIERSGRKALIYRKETLDAIGLPIGWEPCHVNPKDDHITISRYDTRHVKGSVRT